MQGIFGLTEGGFVCLGFVWPHNSQMLFKDKNRSINRHPSGVYSTIDENGNTEFYHPSGAYIRIGSSEAHEDLSGKDRDGSWKIGGASAGYIAVVQAGGKAKLTVKPDGQIDIESAKDINIKSSQEVNIIGTAINFTMGGTTMRLDGGHAIVTTSDISFTGNAQVYGNMKVNGDLKVDGSVKASGGITEHTGV